MCLFFQVLSITVSCKEDGTSSGPQAHVAWYGSSTSSLMSCDQLSPFLETFKVDILFIHIRIYIIKKKNLFHLERWQFRFIVDSNF